MIVHNRVVFPDVIRHVRQVRELGNVLNRIQAKPIAEIRSIPFGHAEVAIGRREQLQTIDQIRNDFHIVFRFDISPVVVVAFVLNFADEIV